MLPNAPDEARLAEVVRSALQHWALDIETVEMVGHTENIVFRASTADAKQYVVRLHRPGYSSLAALNSERQWTAALREAGILAPAGVPAADGRNYVEVDMPDGSKRHVGVLEWVDGELLGDVIQRDESGMRAAAEFERLGRVAARIHNQSSTWTLPDGFVRRSWDADGLMGDEPLWGRFWELPGMTAAQRQLFLDARERIHGVLKGLPKTPATYSLIHSDLHPQNVVLGPEGPAIIDFDDAGFGWHAYELAVALFRTQGRGPFEVAEPALVAGYRSERPFSEADRGLLPMFMLVRGLAVLGWANARPELGLAQQMLPFRERVLGQAEAFLEGRLRF